MGNQKRVKAILEEEAIIIKDEKEANTLHQQGWYGKLKNNKLIIDPFEALHLIERKKIILYALNDQGEREVSAQEASQIFSKNNKTFWRNYVVYKDLRNRGYVVRIGQKNDPFFFKLYPRGTVPNKTPYEAIIIPLQEGTGFPIKELDEVIRIATSTRKKLVFALVDSLGDISYVTVNELELEDISNDKEFPKWEKRGEKNEGI